MSVSKIVKLALIKARKVLLIKDTLVMCPYHSPSVRLGTLVYSTPWPARPHGWLGVHRSARHR
jgi:hypothetical protein